MTLVTDAGLTSPDAPTPAERLVSVASRPAYRDNADNLAWLIQNLEHLKLTGRIPARAEQVHGRRTGRISGAPFEGAADIFADLDRVWPWLPPADRELLELRGRGLSFAALGAQLRWSPTTVKRRWEAAIDRLVVLLNREDESMARALEGTQTPNQTAKETEAEAMHQALSRKLRDLPPGVNKVLIQRTPAGEFNVSVQY